MELNYYTCGDGFPLIVLHGLLGSSDNWQTLSKKFSEHYKVFALDLRNHGASPHSDQFDYPSMVEDLREFLDAQGINRCHLLGHSMGGKTAMQFSADHPERVEKLVVADIGPKAYPPYHTDILDALWSLDLPQFESRSDTDEALAVNIPDSPLRSFLLKSVTRDKNGKFTWKINLKTIREQYANVTAALEIKAPFTKPTLFIRGEKSEYILPEDEEKIRLLFPTAQFAAIPDAGHWLHSQKPQEFFEIANSFLRG